MKRVISMFLMICLIMPLLVSMPVSAYDNISGIYKYAIVNGEAAIIGCSKEAHGDIIVPSFIDGYPVTEIAIDSFSSRKSITSITIPSSVTTIDDHAFVWCDNLSNIIVDEQNTTYSSIDGNLFSKNKKTFIRYAPGKNNANYTIPDGVTMINHFAFKGCDNLTSIIIPKSVTKIGNHAFRQCDNLSNIIVDEQNTTYSSIDGNLFSKNKRTLIQYAVGKINTTYAIPDGVTMVNAFAFYGCSSLTSIMIASSMTSIGPSSFYGCGSLTNVIIPDSVISIENASFHSCHSLKNITIPSGVTTIGEGSFNGCSSLTSITIPNVKTIGEGSFSGCSSLTSIAIPNGVTTIGASTFNDCSGLNSIAIPKSVTNIGVLAFDDCRNLKDIYYAGSEDDWNKIQISPLNSCLIGATIHYNSAGQNVSNESFASELEKSNKIKVYLNGELLEFDQEPIIENGRTLVPIRTIAEGLGSYVDWDEKTQTAIIQRGLETAVFQIGNNKAYAREIKKLDVPAKIVNSRTLIPLRAISEIFGAEVVWKEETKEVYITCDVYSEKDIFRDLKLNGFIQFNYFVDSFIEEHMQGGWLNKYAWSNALSNISSWGTRIITLRLGDWEKDAYKENIKTILANITDEKPIETDTTYAKEMFSGVGKVSKLTAAEAKAYFDKEYIGSSLELSNWGEANNAKFLKIFSSGMSKLNRGVKTVSFTIDEWAYILTNYTESMYYLESIKFATKHSDNKPLEEAIDELEMEYAEWYIKLIHDLWEEATNQLADKGMGLLFDTVGSSAGALYDLSTFAIEQGAKVAGAKNYSDNVEDAIALMGIDNNLKFYHKDMIELNYDFLTDTIRKTATDNTWASLVDSFVTTKACTLEAYECMLAVTESSIEKIYLKRQIEIMRSIMINEKLPKSADEMFYLN